MQQELDNTIKIKFCNMLLQLKFPSILHLRRHHPATITVARMETNGAALQPHVLGAEPVLHQAIDEAGAGDLHPRRRDECDDGCDAGVHDDTN